ncbi:hypothetical protein BdWA1_002506 [Babesia duncani]|uniref:Uncharacterized protein n=1 Tax=Babesia duncani TaxID=323732 RepID=A0AAD9UNC9_9APIC|nr:hypothetical protein BdWA1_002506 [Babesia duncani]
MSGHSGDFYFHYNITGVLSPLFGCQIVKFSFNGQEYKFECNKEFMYEFRFCQAFVYACKVGSDKFHPWLLQLVGLSYVSPFDSPSDSSDQSTVNYFFKRDENNWKSLTFTKSLTAKDGSTEHKQNEDNLDQQLESNTELKKYFESLKKSASAAMGYVYKKSDTSHGLEIQPSDLLSYFGQSDKQHKYGSESVSQDYEVSKFTSYSGSGKHSFEIIFKGRQKNKSTGKEQEVTNIFKSSTEDTSKLTQKSEAITTTVSEDLSGSESSCKANQAEQGGSNGRDGGGTGQSEGSEKGSGGSVLPSTEDSQESSKGVSHEDSEQTEETFESAPSSGGGTEEANTAQNSPKASQDSEQPSTGVSSSPAASKSSPNLPGIVCGAVFGSGGLIGGGILIYKCIG